jgi:hypothetical protein
MPKRHKTPEAKPRIKPPVAAASDPASSGPASSKPARAKRGASPPPPPDEPLSVWPPTLPFYARTAQSRAQRASMVRLVDGIGLPEICPRQVCRRAHACRDTDMRDRPFCTFLYRDIVRFVLHAMRARNGEPDREAEPVREMPPPWRGKTLFQRLRMTKADLAATARPADARPDWQLETDPEAQELLAWLRAERAAEVAAKRGGRTGGAAGRPGTPPASG